MRAYLMAVGSQSGATFVTRNSHGDTAYSGAVGSKLGNWGDYTVYGLDFTLSTADTYTITVTGPAPVTSPSFRVDRARQLYSAALANASLSIKTSVTVETTSLPLFAVRRHI